MQGTLIVKSIGALLTINTDFFGKMDPYVVIKIGSTSFRTKTATKMGKYPAWDDIFVFELSGEDTMELYIYDRDIVKKDDFVGHNKIILSKALTIKTETSWYTVTTSKGKKVGQIKLALELKPISDKRFYSLKGYTMNI